MRYRSKPQEVEAVQWTGDNVEEIHNFASLDEPRTIVTIYQGDPELKLKAGKGGAQGWVFVPVGYWIVHNPGDLSDFWPVEPHYFAKKYDPADEGA